MTSQEPEWSPHGDETAPAQAQAIPHEDPHSTSPSLPDAEIDAVRELAGHDRWRNASAILMVAAVLLVIAAILRLLVPGLFGLRASDRTLPSTATFVETAPRPQGTAGAAVTPLPAGSPSPDDFNALLARAGAMTDRSEFKEAIALYQEMANQAPEDVRPQIGWAWALLLDGQARQALTHALHAVELDPVDAEAMAVLARAYAESGDLAHALGMAQNAVQIDPSSASAHTALAQSYLLQGQLQEAVQEAEQALSRGADNAEAHRIRAQLYEAVDGDLEQAIAEFEIAARLQPELWIRQYELGIAQLKAQDYESAVVSLKTALGLRRKAATYTAVGEAYYGLKQYDRAQAFLQQALSAGVVDAKTYALLAAIDARQGRCEDARVFVDQALAQDPAQSLALEARNVCQPGSTVASAPPAAPVPSSTPTEPLPTPASPSLNGWIAFPVWNALAGQYDTYIAQPDGSKRRLAADEMHQPAFSPDGQWLAANGERPQYLNLTILRPDGSELKEITPYIEDGLPSWSPDGQSLAFSSTRHSDRQSRVYVVDQVPLDGKKAEGRALNAEGYEVLGTDPAWTTGNEIVYSGCDYTREPVECGLFAISAEPGPQTPRLLTTQPEDDTPAISGDTIAFMSNRDGNWEIYAVNVDGSELRRLTDNGANDGLPAWSPDGRTLAFVSDQGGVWAVWAMNPDGSNRRKLFDIGGGGLAFDWQQEQISWGP
jgi:TolB protein